MSDEKCAVKGCKSNDIGISYLGRPVCNRCWNKLSEKPVNALRKAIGLKPIENGGEDAKDDLHDHGGVRRLPEPAGEDGKEQQVPTRDKAVDAQEGDLWDTSREDDQDKKDSHE